MMNSTGSTRSRRLAHLPIVLTGYVLSLLASVTPVRANVPFPDLGSCPALQVEAGNKVVSHVYAVGVQIYQWNGTSWAFVAPEAKLFANPGGTGLVGTHYAGPTWESVSGSKVIGAVVERCTPDPSAIPWLLLRAVDDEGPGIFEGVTFIQRLNTAGGLAPSAPGDFVGQEARIPYTTEYFFYRQR